MRKNDLSEFQLEEEGFKITLKRTPDLPQGLPAATPIAVPAMVPVVAPAAGLPNGQGNSSASPAPEAQKETREITSPMVGTFYSSASPESAPYVSVGQEVNEDTVVCIIEAMKVMNEIKAECRGIITEIVAENGKPVQFGQPLFRLR